ncbi:MAG: DUF459 domain-containing protein [Methylobacteriaceae bacterium]|nr:DUF459 domain-containing protein [Methylobacteriaceae bacterium]MBV9703641.1 DUF459 domain-containing protein [Methylobacteriaceae bacterium]
MSEGVHVPAQQLETPPRRSSAFAKFAAIVLFVFLTGGPEVVANDSNDRTPYWSLPQPNVQPEATTPAPRRAATPVTRPRPRARLAEPNQAPAPAPTIQPTFFVAVLGDNLGLMMAQGLQDAFTDKPEIGIVRRVKESSGLARDDYYDWAKAVRDLLAGKDKVDFAVMLVGSNDGQAIRDGANSYDVRSDKWRELYAKRIEDIANQFKDRNIPLMWVGIPIMRNEKLASDAAYINDIFREEAAKTGATYVDTWEGFVDDEGQYDDYGPDLTGQRVKLRTADGVHFTKAGARKLALFAEKDIRAAFDNAKPPVDLAAIVSGQSELAALPPEPTVDINTLIERELGNGEPPAATASPQPGLSSALPGLSPAPVATSAPRRAAEPPPSQPQPAPSIEAKLPAPEAPLEPVIPLKPAAGPIVPLTTSPLSPGGELATRTPLGDHASLGSDAVALLEHTLIEGKPIEPKPGRADDFAWPRP